jgi:hypothetical protein
MISLLLLVSLQSPRDRENPSSHYSVPTAKLNIFPLKVLPLFPLRFFTSFFALSALSLFSPHRFLCLSCILLFVCLVLSLCFSSPQETKSKATVTAMCLMPEYRVMLMANEDGKLVLAI